MIAATQIYLGRGAGGGGWVNPYVTDGLVAMWDGEWNAGGGVHDPNATVWKDLVGGVLMPNCSFGNDYSIPTSKSTTGNVFELSTDFTLHGCLVNANASGNNITMLGIGDDSTSCLQRGFVLSAKSGPNFARVQYRTKPNGAVYNSVSTQATVGEACSFDLVFELASRTFSAYSNATKKGEAQIKQENWVLEGTSVSIGTEFLDYTNIGAFKRHSILYYSRALTAAEIAANYAIDKQRFNLS